MLWEKLVQQLIGRQVGQSRLMNGSPAKAACTGFLGFTNDLQALDLQKLMHLPTHRWIQANSVGWVGPELSYALSSAMP